MRCGTHARATRAVRRARRLLNQLPANRLTATALDAFLKVAGFRMAAAYGRQFLKLLQARPRTGALF
jgi:hypothetical protein